MRAITLSGWGQAHDALREVAPNARHIDYPAHAPIDPALLAICDEAQQADIIIGWSMGGRMAVQAIARGWLKPKRLVLIGVPYQFVQTTDFHVGMGTHTYARFRDNFATNPERTLTKGHLLVAQGDTQASRVKQYLQASRERLKAHNWLLWLEELASLSCRAIDFSDFPPTLLIHGSADAVVDCRQAALFKQRLSNARQVMMPGSGHAPHWHDPDSVKQWIEEFCGV